MLALLALTATTVAFTPPAVQAEAPPKISVGANVRVSQGAEARQHWEVLAAAHPTDPNQLMACTMVDPHRLGQRGMHSSVYMSADGGKNWTFGRSIEYSGDPVCKYDPDGIPYFGALTSGPPGMPADEDPADFANPMPDPWNFALYRSLDKGRAWEQKQPFWSGDRPWLLFDTTSGPARGRLYVAYQSRVRPLDAEQGGPASVDLAVSRDGGATWDQPRAYGAVTEPTTLHSIPNGLAQLSDGTLLVSNWQNLRRSAPDTTEAASWPPTNRPTCKITLTIIPAGGAGKTQPKSVKVADKWCAESQTTRVADSLAVDSRSAAFTDRIYIAWADIKSGNARIMTTYSADRGATWSRPRVVDDVPRTTQHAPDNFMATLAVNADGVVGLTWNDRRDSPDNIGYHVRFAASLDGGETWTPSARVSETPARYLEGERPLVRGFAGAADGQPGPITIGVTGRGGFTGGDTAGLAAAADGAFHAVWTDNRTGTDQLYTAPIRVEGVVSKHGSAALAALNDVTPHIALELSELIFDEGSRTITMDAIVRNPSSKTLTGRLVGRVVGMSSALGDPVILNADNGAPGVGATFDFTMPSGGLAPKAALTPRRIQVRLDNLTTAPKTGEDLMKILAPQYLSLGLQLLGTVSGAEAR